MGSVKVRLVTISLTKFDEGQICRLHRVTESAATSGKKSNPCFSVCQKTAAGVGFAKI